MALKFLPYLPFYSQKVYKRHCFRPNRRWLEVLRDEFTMCLPNLNMKGIFAEYFNEIHGIDVATKHTDMMSEFIHSFVIYCFGNQGFRVFEVREL